MPDTVHIILTPGDYLLAKDSQTQEWLKAFSCSQFVGPNFLSQVSFSSHILREINSQKKRNRNYTECIYDAEAAQRIDLLMRFNEDFCE